MATPDGIFNVGTYRIRWHAEPITAAKPSSSGGAFAIALYRVVLDFPDDREFAPVAVIKLGYHRAATQDQPFANPAIDRRTFRTAGGNARFEGLRRDLAARLSGGLRLYLESADGIKPAEQTAGAGTGSYRAVCAGLPIRCCRCRPCKSARRDRTRNPSPFALRRDRLASPSTSGFACTWLWDQQATRTAGSSVGVDTARLRVLPETALQPPLGQGCYWLRRSTASKASIGSTAASVPAAGGRDVPMRPRGCCSNAAPRSPT